MFYVRFDNCRLVLVGQRASITMKIEMHIMLSVVRFSSNVL